MIEWTLFFGALWMGVLTSISPCPLATNIAAVAFLSRRSTEKPALALSSLAYISGRTLAYTLLAGMLVAGLLSAPSVAEFFRSKLEGLIGPMLIILGMIVSGLITLKIPGFGNLNQLGTRLAEKGFVGEFLMGVIFALAFCPVSAALFFGGLLPSIVQSGSTILLPITYGIGTALPVVIAVVILAGGVTAASRRIQTMQVIGAKLQIYTGYILILVGIWMTFRDLF